MPTIAQLVRKGRKRIAKKTKKSLDRFFYDTFKRGIVIKGA